jgi:hypothetical protein
MSEAFEWGRASAVGGVPLRCNPYLAGSVAFAQWTYGHDAGRSELDKKRTTPPPANLGGR